MILRENPAVKREQGEFDKPEIQKVEKWLDENELNVKLLKWEYLQV